MTAYKNTPWMDENPDRVQILAPICVKYGHPNLEEIDRYLCDFGLVKGHENKDEEGTKCVHYHGYGVQPVLYIAAETKEPRFYGVYFEAQSEADLERAQKIPGAAAKRPFLDGYEVPITDPNGAVFHVVHGIKKREFSPRSGQLQPFNYPAPTDKDSGAKPRRGDFHRLSKGPIPVHKLGHCGIVAASLEDSCDYYCHHFNFKPSDVMLRPDGGIGMIFLHIDLGEAYSDHHSFFIAGPQGPAGPGSPHHAAFEVESIDTNFVGHEYLKSKGYKNFWGVGRHIEGSQVFDYWFDLDGFLLEHYADGDIVNKDHPVNFVPHRPFTETNNWGPPPTFLEAH